VFEKPKPLVGVLQLLPLPGSVGWKGRIDQVIARAEQEATAMATGGLDALLVENTWDMPYPADRMDMAGAVAMGLIIRRIMHFTNLPIGINVLRNDPETALAIAMNVGAKFIRVPLLTGAALSETGILEGRYAQLAVYRQKLMADNIAVYADISLGKAMPLLPVTLKTLAQQALSIGQADGLILTDSNLSPADIQEVSHGLDAPVLFDFPHDVEHLSPYLEAADGLILSNAMKKSSVTMQDLKPTVDLTKVEEATASAEIIRNQLVGV